MTSRETAVVESHESKARIVCDPDSVSQDRDAMTSHDPDPVSPQNPAAAAAGRKRALLAGIDRKGALDGGWGWMIVLGSVLGHFTLVGLSRSMGIMYMAIVQHFDASDTATTLSQSLFNTCRTVIGPVVAVLCDRFSSRRVVLVGGFMYGAGVSISAAASSIIYLNISFGIVAGIGGGLLFTPMFIMLNQYFDKNKGKAMAFSTVGSGLGTIVLALLSDQLLQYYSYFGAMLILGAIVFNSMISGALFRPIDSLLNMPYRTQRALNLKSIELEDTSTLMLDPKDSGEAVEHIAPPDENENGAPPDEVEVVSVRPGKKQRCFAWCHTNFAVLGSLRFLLFSFNITALPCVVQIFLMFSPSHMKQHGLDQSTCALVLSIASATDIVSRFFWGFVFDVASVRPYRRPLHHGMGLAMGVAVALMASQTHFLGFVAVGVLWGLFEGGWHSQRATIGSEIVPKDQMSKSMGFMTFFQGIGNLIWPTLAGVLKDVTGNYRVCFHLAAAVILLSSALLMGEYCYWRYTRARRERGGSSESR